MKIDALYLTAFGPFTDTTLDFTCNTPGFHLVYGPNEAGKSSALRALRALLYGIDERTPDSFIHPYGRLRIGGKLTANNGRSLEIVRRKGRTNTLRAADDQTVVDEEVLAGFLNHVDADLFATMFGIGYDDLVAGGRQVVSGRGDLGQLVFSAGSGIVRLKEIRDNLQNEAESLFKPSGKNPAINAALFQLKENEKQLKETILPGNRWTALDEELKNAIEKRRSVEAELQQNQKARHHLARIKEALPLIARRREVTESLKQYEHIPLLPGDFPETRRDLVTRLDLARKEAQRAQKAINSIEAQMAELSPNDAVIENAELIEEFHKQLGGQHKAAAERVKLETGRATLLDECRSILRSLSDSLSIEDAEHLRIKKDQAAAIRRLSSEYEHIIARIENARDSLPGTEEEIKRLEEKKQQMPEPPDSESMDALENALKEAGEYGPIEKQNQQDIKALEARRTSLDIRLNKLGLSGKTALDLEKLPVPEIETIQKFEDRFEQAAKQVKEITGELKKTADQIRETEAKIQADQMVHGLPSEQDLKDARALRDRYWHSIRRKLTGAPPNPDAPDPYRNGGQNPENIEDAFEQHVKTSDEIADRLRREADRVAEHARLRADLEAAIQKKQDLAAQQEKAEKEREKQSNQWRRLWAEAAVTPGAPREMDRWSRDLAAVKEDLFEFEDSLQKAKDLDRAINTRRAALAGALKTMAPKTDPDNDPLNRLISRAQKIIENEKKLAAEFEKIDSDLASRKKELSAAKSRLQAGEKAFERWRAQWQQAVFPLGLSADAKPEEANAVMEEIRTLFDKLGEAENLHNRIQAIDRDAQSFSRAVSGLADTVAPDLSNSPAEDIALKLHTRLTRSRDARTRYDALEKQLASEKQNLEKSEKTESEIKTRLWRMCEEAGCKDYHELPGAEQHAKDRRSLQEELKSLDERILALSAGATVDEFAKAAALVDPDTIDPEISRYDEAIAALSERKDSLIENIGSLGNEMSKMDGSAQAAELAEERQEILGRLQPDVEHYARVKIAARVLDTAIERFREKNQGPMLGRASELFTQITCGSFKGVRADFDESGTPVITGVRGSDGQPVPVSAMSDGTADQLYLALRLAGLEMTIDKTDPMPFIVDDILIKFDNERAAAALKILAELSERTQVIFFTHHYHLIELAKERMPQDTVAYHKL
ncbi:MAG: AAA family ATPase [Desulfobacterales bacterium]